MKATLTSIAAPLQPAARITVPLLLDLFKARLTSLVLLTTLVGFYVGTVGPLDFVLMLHTLL